MARFGLCGGSYQSASTNIDAERTVNLIPEINGPDAKSAMSMLATPGTQRFTHDLPGTFNRALYYEPNGNRVFVVSAGQFSEVLFDGTTIDRGGVADDGKPASVCQNNAAQLFICAGGGAYCYNLATNVLTAIDTSGGPALQAKVIMGGFCDGFFVALLKDGRFQVSAPEDGLTWDPTQIAKISVFPDEPLAMIVDHREVFFFSQLRGQVYWDTGDVFPLSPAPGAYLQKGLCGSWTWAQIDNTIFALMFEADGGPVAMRLNGYTPQRISNPALEYAWAQLNTAAGAICHAEMYAGHPTFVIQFPGAITAGFGQTAADTTYCYDIAAGLWYERRYLDPNTGVSRRHRAMHHIFPFFGKHLVGDTESGDLYQMELPTQLGGVWSYVTDDGAPIQRLRRAPHISNEQEWIRYNSLQIDMETGDGPQPPLLDGAGNPRDPQIMLRWTDDGGHNWSNYHILDCGQAGQFLKRAIFRRVGRSRDRIYEISMTDPIGWKIIDGYLQAEPGFDKPTERLASRMRKMS